jgi:hypothetical protein
MLKDLFLSVFGFVWSLVTGIAQLVFVIAGLILVAVAAFAFFEWFSGRHSRNATGSNQVAILFPRIGEWTQEGCDAFAKEWRSLCLGSCVACGVTLLSFGILAGPMTAGLTQMALAALRSEETPLSLSLLWKGFSVTLSSILYILAQVLLAFCGVYVLLGFGFVGDYLAGLYVALIQTVLMFGMFFISDQKANVFSALTKSAVIVSWGPFVFLMLYAVAASLGSIGGVFFGLGAILTLPIQLCVLGAAFNDIVSHGDGEPSRLAATAPVSSSSG